MPETPAAPAQAAVPAPAAGFRFKLGLALIIGNWPVGYGATALALAWGHATGRDKIGAGIAVGLYVLSWLMLGAGLALAGKDGLRHAKELWRLCGKRLWGRRTPDA